MSIGIRLHDAAGRNTRERAASAAQQGFLTSQVALAKTYDETYIQPAALTPGLARQVQSECAPLSVSVLGCYLNLAHPDPVVYEQLLATYTAHLRFAKWLNAGVVGTETGNPNADYRYDPQRSHTQEALQLFIDRLHPVVDAAEKLGAVLALEPVYSHIVSTPKRLRYVLDTVRSPNLMVILDPVNLLHADNVDHRDAVLDEAVELLLADTAALHIKDFALDNGQLVYAPTGTGILDLKRFFARVAPHKPGIDLLLEDTRPDNALAALDHVRALWQEAGGSVQP